MIMMIKSRMMTCVHVACIGEMGNAYGLLFRKPEAKRPLARHSHKWEDNTNMYFMEIRWECVDWIYLAQDRDQRQALVNTVMNHQIL
jgi:hypothetical protein